MRDIAQETKTAKARGDDKRNAERHKARRMATKLGLVKPNDGKDVDHRHPLSKGGATTVSNLRVRSPAKNRGFPRNADGSMKTNEGGK